jgi:hypothetical protein
MTEVMGSTCSEDSITPASAPALRPLRSFGTLPRDPMTASLVQTRGLAHRSDSASRRALRPFLDASPRYLDSASTTDVHVTSTRLDRRFRRLSAERRGGNRQRSTSGPASLPGVSACRFEIGAGPPRGDPASGDSALDGAAPASGRMAPIVALTRPWGWSRRRLFGCRRARQIRAL